MLVSNFKWPWWLRLAAFTFWQKIWNTPALIVWPLQTVWENLRSHLLAQNSCNFVSVMSIWITATSYHGGLHWNQEAWNSFDEAAHDTTWLGMTFKSWHAWMPLTVPLWQRRHVSMQNILAYVVWQSPSLFHLAQIPQEELKISPQNTETTGKMLLKVWQNFMTTVTLSMFILVLCDDFHDWYSIPSYRTVIVRHITLLAWFDRLRIGAYIVFLPKDYFVLQSFF